MSFLQWVMFGLAWPVAIGLFLTLWANRVTMLPMTWNKQPDEDIWTLELDDLDGTAIITATVPHTAEIHFGRGDALYVQDIGSFQKWDDAARMTEHYITALRQEVAAV